MDNKLCLLITGCINPNKNQKYLFLKDTEERLNQYIESILYYIRYSPFKKIVFCDNSNFIYENNEEIYLECKKYNKSFEWLSFLGNRDKVVICGKGYGEGEIIKYALEKSKLLQKSVAFFKVTGRLKIVNINDIANRIKVNRIYFNRDVYSVRKAIDTRFYSVDINFYKENLLNVYQNLDMEKRSLECAFWDSLNQHIYRNFPEFPVVEGISGGNGRNYAESSNFKIKFFNIMCKCNMFNIVCPIYIAYKKLLSLKK